MKRTMEHLVQDPLAQIELAGQVGDGETVALTVRQGRLELGPVGVAEPVGYAAASG